MDDQRFDQLSRRLGASRTRRQALRAIAGAVIAGVAGVKAADAQTCTAHYQSCQGDGECCSGSVCQWGMCMPGCRIEGAFANAWTSPPGDICQVCTPELSTTAWSPANEGVPCWSGDPNAGTTTCQSGACAPVAVTTVSCPPLTACHLEGEVDPNTGMCVYPFAPAGTPCGIGEMCHGGFYQPADACDGNGFCIGGGSKTVSCAPYSCAGTACATSCSSAADCEGDLDCIGGRCGYCDAVTLGTSECSSDDHCGEGETCRNGGCFRLCSGSCSQTCANCRCRGQHGGGVPTTCLDASFGIGACASNADCPAGSLCSNFASGSTQLPGLCTRPCPTWTEG